MNEIVLDRSSKWTFALFLAIATIGYNLIEGVVSVWFGLQDETLALFGFGADSFIEVISAIGVVHMIARMRRRGLDDRDAFERTALKITGSAFYALTVVLTTTAAVAIFTEHQPETTVAGVVISGVSIAFMWALINAKVKVGTELSCQPIISDANCSRVCLQMSIVLLASSAIYHFTGFGFVDSIGAIALAWYSLKEGRECFEKAKGNACDDDCC